MLKRKSSLKIINKISIFKNLIKKLHNQKSKKPVILIPTMGALHQGHLSLIKKGKKIGGTIIVTIFINPIQFNDKNDLKNYPITLQEDISKLSELKVDFLLIPKIEDIFEKNFQTTVIVKDLQKIQFLVSVPKILIHFLKHVRLSGLLDLQLLDKRHYLHLIQFSTTT